jgi:hypothetical protein
MSTTAFRTHLTTLLAGTAVALAALAPSAHATQQGTGGPSQSTGRMCKTDGDGLMADGDVTIRRSRNQRSTTTCTDGTLCTSTGVKQGNGTWIWRYECTDSAARRIPARRGPKNTAMPATTKQTTAAATTGR